MLLKPLTMAILLATTQSTLAATWSYDFSGTFDDHFAQVHDYTVGDTISMQANGGFIFSNEVAEPGDGEGVAYVHRQFNPTYGQSWSFQIDATIPLGLDGLPNNLDWYLSAGLEVAFDDGTGDSFTFSYMLENGNMGDLGGTPPLRKYLGEYYVNGNDIWDIWPSNDPKQITNLETVTLRIDFNQQSKVLTASNSQYGDFISVNTSGWGMSNDDSFMVAYFFSTEGHAVPNVTPLAFDNFSASVQPVPEPETYALMLAGLGLVGFAAGRRKST